MRTIQTAHCIAVALDLSVKIEHGVCELLHADWYNTMPVYLSPSECAQRFPRVDQTYTTVLDPRWPESEKDLHARCARIVNHLADTYATDILLVGHGAAVLSCAQGLLAEKTEIHGGLCSLTKIERGPDGAVLALNGDASHLSTGEQARDKFV